MSKEWNLDDPVERMCAGLTAELVEDDEMRVHVVTQGVSLGWVSAAMIYQDPDGARLAIERIRTK